jgi:hypothetical protein
LTREVRQADDSHEEGPIVAPARYASAKSQHISSLNPAVYSITIDDFQRTVLPLRFAGARRNAFDLAAFKQRKKAAPHICRSNYVVRRRASRMTLTVAKS